MIKVTQENENTFTIEWDENDPGESIFNSFTEKDFIDVLQYYCEQELSKLDYTEGTSKESRETYYNSESEGKEFEDNFYSPEEYGTWDCYHKDCTDAP
jgi:hypothetical protein